MSLALWVLMGDAERLPSGVASAINRRKDDTTPIQPAQSSPPLLTKNKGNRKRRRIEERNAKPSPTKQIVQSPSSANENNDQSLIQSDSECSIPYDKFGSLLDNKMEKFKTSLMQDIVSHVRNEISKVIDSLKDDLTRSIEFLAEEQNSLKQDLIAAKDKIKELEKDKFDLTNNIKTIERRLDTLDKASRSCNVEIQCVPQKKEESLPSLVKKICDTVGFQIQENNIYSVRRVAKLNPTSPRPRSIILTLQSERDRDMLLSAYKRFNKGKNICDTLNSNHLMIPGEKHRIYLSEHSSPTCKMLHAEARKLSKQFKYKYVWVRNDKVYMRKDDNAIAIYIKDTSSFDKLNKTTT
ncbi:uncharacterized protein LOC123696217 [Colias croceus]|uniref:uncharacterized protein LOC123696217 n=1 Tax=Colias crocea TaxID=72248 RepID=UPI001E2819D8|nr:uncharacterized protein LOC123696217 [Colias croceus]